MPETNDRKEHDLDFRTVSNKNLQKKLYQVISEAVSFLVSHFGPKR